MSQEKNLYFGLGDSDRPRIWVISMVTKYLGVIFVT